MTHTDPSADAFMRRILADPADPVPRLVFADWLEETETSSNIAWARYLRLADELASLPAGDARRPKLQGLLGHVSRSIRAKLTFRAETLAAYPDAMLRLLPARNLVVDVETVVLKRSLVELLPESVARENRILPVGILEDRSHLFAAVEPTDRDLAERIQFILNRAAVFVGMKESGVVACLDRNYGPSETESVDSILYNWLPSDGLRDGPPGQADSPSLALGNLLLLEAFLYVAGALEFETDGTRLTVWHWFGSLRRRRDYSPAGESVSQLVPLLRSHLRNPVTDPGGSLRGEITVAWWDEPRTLSVRIADRPNGHNVFISIPPWVTNQPTALNPAA